MILIGQFDSPFVRRVGIAMRLYGLPFEHRPWSVFSDADALLAVNPLMRVPTLVLDDAMALTDSHMILDYIDSLVERPMVPRTEPQRHRALRVATLACGAAEKAVSLFYERRLHELTSEVWTKRCKLQITAVLTALEAERAATATRWWFGADIGHADIALACMLRFVAQAHPGLLQPGLVPRLTADAARAESLAVFQEISQDFLPPA